MTHIDPGLARDIEAMERGLLIDPDPGALPVYADMLEDSGDGTPWRGDAPGCESACGWVRRVGAFPRVRYDILAPEAREGGLLHLSRPVRIAWACAFDASHPVESAELRLSIAAGQWPWRTRGPRRLPCGALWVRRRNPDGAHIRWHVGRKPHGTESLCYGRAGPGWAVAGTFGELFPVAVADADAAVRAAARKWIEGLLS